MLVDPTKADDDAIEVLDQDIVLVGTSAGASAAPSGNLGQALNGKGGDAADGITAEVSKKRPANQDVVEGEGQGQEVVDSRNGAPKKSRT